MARLREDGPVRQEPVEAILAEVGLEPFEIVGAHLVDRDHHDERGLPGREEEVAPAAKRRRKPAGARQLARRESARGRESLREAHDRKSRHARRKPRDAGSVKFLAKKTRRTPTSRRTRPWRMIRLPARSRIMIPAGREKPSAARRSRGRGLTRQCPKQEPDSVVPLVRICAGGSSREPSRPQPVWHVEMLPKASHARFAQSITFQLAIPILISTGDSGGVEVNVDRVSSS